MPLCAQITITPVALAISSDSGYDHGLTIDKFKITDTIDIQNEGVKSLGAAAGTLNLDLRSYQVFECESNASENFLVNLRGTSTVSLSKSLRKGDSKTVTLFVKNGSTPYYCSGVKIDGTALVQGTDLFWTGEEAPTFGTKLGWDEYQFTARKQQNGTIIVRAVLAGAK